METEARPRQTVDVEIIGLTEITKIFFLIKKHKTYALLACASHKASGLISVYGIRVNLQQETKVC